MKSCGKGTTFLASYCLFCLNFEVLDMTIVLTLGIYGLLVGSGAKMGRRWASHLNPRNTKRSGSTSRMG